MKYEISNTISGASLGVYDAASEAEALDAMAREAGYQDYASLCEVVPAEDGEIVVSIVVADAITRIEALESNSGQLFLAIFSGDTCTHFFGEFQYGGTKAPSLQEEIAGALADGVEGWDGNDDDPQACYDGLTSHQYGWKLIAEWQDGELAVYEDEMGVAGRIWARVQDEE